MYVCVCVCVCVCARARACTLPSFSAHPILPFYLTLSAALFAEKFAIVLMLMGVFVLVVACMPLTLPLEGQKDMPKVIGSLLTVIASITTGFQVIVKLL